MPKFTLLSAAEQAANHLYERILSGIWGDEIPGAPTLAVEFGINHVTVIAALQLLEHEGMLVNQGAGRRRKIVLPMGGIKARGMRVALLVFDSPARDVDYIIDLRHLLEESGHVPFFPDKTLEDLGMDVRRVARFVKKTEADAWVVGAASKEVLEWFSAQETPAFALFGIRHGVPIAATGPDKAQPLAEATRRLIALGHRRISFLCRSQHHLPQLGRWVHSFLSELETAGIATGRYNLPDWQESGDGFKRCLDSLFGGPTPPTALILDEAYVFNAGFHHLAKRSLRVPEDVSMICTDHDPTFIWCDPSVAHIRWDYRPVVRRVARWVNNVARGKDDRRQSFTKAEFVEGGTVGRAP
jgi:DNA-binding LacI/PurR family transcriptional regulator